MVLFLTSSPSLLSHRHHQHSFFITKSSPASHSFSLHTNPSLSSRLPGILRAIPPDPSTTGIPDEWGERSDPEPEAPSATDPPQNEDEWGEAADESGVEYGSNNGSVAQQEELQEDEVEDLKRCLVDSFYGTELGLRTSSEVRAEVLEIVNQLEAKNPTPAPTDTAELLDGNWVLLYTAFSELLPLIAVGSTPFFKVQKISQIIDTKNLRIVNVMRVSSPFASLSVSAAASFEVRSSSRIQVRFEEGIFDPPEISSTVNLPENFDVFGRKIDLSPIQGALNPIQEAAANIIRAVNGQPPLKFPIPGERSSSWLLTTYLDKDLRISRGDGGLFVLAKEGSSLLDQL